MSSPELHSRNTSDEIHVIYLCTKDQPFRVSDTGNLERRQMGVRKVKMKEEISPRKNTLEDFLTPFLLYFNDNMFQEHNKLEICGYCFISVFRK